MQIYLLKKHFESICHFWHAIVRAPPHCNACAFDSEIKKVRVSDVVQVT